MWSMLSRRLFPPLLAVYYKEALKHSLSDLLEALVSARRARWELSRNLEEMAQAGKESTPEFQQLKAAHQQLSVQVEQVQQGLKAKQDKMMSELGPTNPLAGFRNYLGVPPLGMSTLGPKDSGKPGIVSTGTEVINLQKFLRAYGFQINATGEFDVQTRLVLQKFQEEHGLPSPSETIVGVETRQLVNDMIEGK